MVEMEKVVETEGQMIGKQLNDRSYRPEEREESGVESMPSGGSNVSNGMSDAGSHDSSGYGSSEKGGKSAWEDFEGEVVNISTFNLEAMQSSNVIERNQDCEISTIEHTNDTPRLRKDGKYNSTTIKSECRNKVKDEPLWKVMNVTSVSKNFSCDQYRHAEYTSSFNPNETFSFLEETGSSNDAFPIPLNPMYDLQALVMFGSPLKGPFYEDHCSLRVQELARVKGNKLILSKMKFELAAVRPGSLSENGVDMSIRYDEDRIKLLRVLATEKCKEVKTLVLEIKVLGEMFRESGANTRCFIKDLNALDCRAGCMVCVLEKIAKRMKDGFPSIEEGPENRMSTLRDLAEILEKCDSVTWLTTDEQIVSILEFMLWDAVRVGISLHLSGTSPCLLFDLERLVTLTKNALGDYYFDNLYKMVKVASSDVDITLFNDDNESWPIHKREHMIHLEITGIFGCSEQMFTGGMRAWDGTAEICYKNKTKRKMTYAGRDIGNTLFSKKVVDDDTLAFKGSASLPSARPNNDTKLYPMNNDMRTIIG